MTDGANQRVLYGIESKHQIKKEGVASSLNLLPCSLPQQAGLGPVECSGAIAEGGAEDAQLFDVSVY